MHRCGKGAFPCLYELSHVGVFDMMKEVLMAEVLLVEILVVEVLMKD